MNATEIATQAAIAPRQKRPRPQELVAALLDLEKQFRRDRPCQALETLAGNWQLRFVTGKTRSSSPGGFYLPGFLQVAICYFPETEEGIGRVENRVSCGPLNLKVTGPIRWQESRGILAFDFTQIQLDAFARKLYQGPLRGGPDSEADFASTTLAKSAFFTYFWTSPQAIAARGRGGGLALWSRAA